MKKLLVNLIRSAVVLTALIALFARCESDATELAQFDAMASRNLGATLTADVCDCLTSQYAVETLSGAEADALMYMREEEKLARDVYTALYQKWNVPVFANISDAEQRHMDAVLCLLNKYGLADPAAGNPAGTFTNKSLQALYNKLYAEGAQSVLKAYLVGASIEDLDIADLLDRMKTADNADITAVFGELMKGSRNHLRAFVRNLGQLGADYTPAYISPTAFEEIISTPRETGGAICGICPNQQNAPCKGPGKCQGGNGPGNGTCTGTGPGNGNGPGKGNRNGKN